MNNYRDLELMQAQVNDGFSVLYKLTKQAADAFSDGETNKSAFFLDCISEMTFRLNDRIEAYDKAVVIDAKAEQADKETDDEQ